MFITPRRLIRNLLLPLLKTDQSGTAEFSCTALNVFTFEPSFSLQVVMPTVEADVAFGLGKYDMSLEEVKSRVIKALDAVGMQDYMQVGYLN